MNERAKELLRLLSEECDSMQDINDLLKELFSGCSPETVSNIFISKSTRVVPLISLKLRKMVKARAKSEQL